MKITKDQTIKTIKSDRIHWIFNSKYAGLIPNSAIFTAEFLIEGFNHEPTVQGLYYKDWLNSMLNNKLIYDVNIADSSEILELGKYFKRSDPYLAVENSSLEYITRTLLTITESVLDEGFKILSLSYDF